MNTLVHLIMAHHIQALICRQLGVRLNRIGFSIGNILPDLDEKLIKISHYPHESLNQVCLMASQIEQALQIDRPILSYQLSLNIGIICHFVSDFFCHVHSVRFKESMFKHCLYELKMLFEIRKPVLHFTDHYHPMVVRPDDIQPYLTLQSGKYEAQNQQMSTDLRFAMGASADIAASMILGSVSSGTTNTVVGLAARMT